MLPVVCMKTDWRISSTAWWWHFACEQFWPSLERIRFVGATGVTGLIVYFCLLFCMHYLFRWLVAAVWLVIPTCLPPAWRERICELASSISCHARRGEDSQSEGGRYNKCLVGTFIFALLTGVLPAVCFYPYQYAGSHFHFPAAPDCLARVFLKQELQGYTGGAVVRQFLLMRTGLLFGNKQSISLLRCLKHYGNISKSDIPRWMYRHTPVTDKRMFRF